MFRHTFGFVRSLGVGRTPRGSSATKSENAILESGSLEEILKWLISVTGTSRCISNFLTSYKKFCTAEELIDLLQRHCSRAFPRLPLFLKIWVETYYFRDFSFFVEDTIQPKKVRDNLMNLIESMTKAGFGQEVNSVKLLVLRYNDYKQKSASPKLSRNVKEASFTSFKPKELAQQLTLMEWKVFQRIDRDEFYNKGWSSNQREICSPNIVKMIHRSNELSYWVATLIVSQRDIKLRSRIVEKLIAIAKYCKRLSNFNTMMAIVLGIEMWAVSRLPLQLSSKYQAIVHQLKKLMNPMHNWLNYRTLLKQSTKSPILPYLGVFLRDVTYIEDGNPDFLPGDRINFEKVMLMGEMLKQFEAYQKHDYSKLIVAKPVLQQFLSHLHVLSEEEVERCSFTIEPLPDHLDLECRNNVAGEEEQDFSFISEYSESMVSEESECRFFTDDEDEQSMHNHYYIWAPKK